MENGNNQSVFYLISQLCDNFASKTSQPTSKLTRKLRSKCFQVLLSKGTQQLEQDTFLTHITDPICHLLIWQYILAHDHNRPDYVEKLKECVDRLYKCNTHSKDVRDRLLYLLLLLRRPPAHDDGIMNKNVMETYSNTLVKSQLLFGMDDDKFKLPSALLCCSLSFTNDSFCLKSKLRYSSVFRPSHKLAMSTFYKPKYCNCIISASNLSCRSFNSFDENFNYFYKRGNELLANESVWELVLEQPFSGLRNWEYYSNREPEKEPPFLTELADKSYLWNDMLILLDFYSLRDVKLKCISYKEFVKDVKYLLVGIESNSFEYKSSEEEFCLIKGVHLKDMSLSSLESYCIDFLFCGNCYRFLDKISKNAKFKHQQFGLIFHEFCESIRRYFSYYRIVVFAISDNTNLLTLYERTSVLKRHMAMLTSICKLVPFEENGFLCGIKLLNALYFELFQLADKNVVMVFYSILIPCCQLYLRHFLHQWLFDGWVNDSCNEFFIKPNSRYISTRGRTYWTRSFTICDDLVPDFLMNIKSDILACGKAMNLLKLCVPNSPLCLYLMGRKPLLMKCCLTRNQLVQLEQNTNFYYLKASKECGMDFTLAEVIERRQTENDPVLMDLIAKKRTATLERILLERQKKAKDQIKRKQIEILQLKEHYDKALEEKQLRVANEIQSELSLMEANINLQNMRDKLIEEEAKTLICYYSELMKASEQKHQKLVEHVQKLKKIHLNEVEPHKEIKSDSNLSVSIADDLYQTNELDQTETTDEIIMNNESPQSPHSLDILNANANDEGNDNVTLHVEEVNVNILNAYENFETAKRNKAKVMSTEFALAYAPAVKSETNRESVSDSDLTEAQKNKLRVLSSEYGIYSKITKSSSDVDLVKRKNSTGNTNFERTFDNENFINRNVEIGDSIKVVDNNQDDVAKKKTTLVLDALKKNNEINNEENNKISRDDEIGCKMDEISDRPIPMSVDSTPLSEFSPKIEDTSSKLFLKIGSQFESLQTDCVIATCTTAASNFTDEGFSFDLLPKAMPSAVFVSTTNGVKSPAVSNEIMQEDPKAITTSCVKLFLQQSVLIPVIAQTKLVNSELLKYFIVDQQYLNHVINLKNYFFLQDGEFGKNMTERLFEKLYDVDFPNELINCRALQILVRNALDSSYKNGTDTNLLSFKINNLPQFFDLGDPNVLNCLSLTYKIGWPLNILLPVDTIAKYDEVFKYLLKLHRLSWVQKKIFEELKVIAKETGQNVVYLKASPHFRRLHQCRYVMTHFVQTLQNYMIGEVLQTNWKLFENNLKSVINLDQLYVTHTNYIKNILFMCLLNQRSAPIMKVIEKIFIVMLKFYDYLRSCKWTLEDGLYVHPNFDKLESIFMNFEEFVRYLFKVGQKLVATGYQPHLLQLLDMLNINGYYTDRKLQVSNANDDPSCERKPCGTEC